MTMRPLPVRDVESRLALTRADYAELLAAARAAIAADRDGLRDPLTFVRGVLADRGQLPPAGADVQQLLAAVPADLREPGNRVRAAADTPAIADLRMGCPQSSRTRVRRAAGGLTRPVRTGNSGPTG
jgi:hypothetical protein